jgi:hypothetical protein
MPLFEEVIQASNQVSPWVKGTRITSELSAGGASATKNAQLTLKLKLHMVAETPQSVGAIQAPATDPSGTPIYYIPIYDPVNKTLVNLVRVAAWDPGVFKTYCEAVKKLAVDFWDNTKLVLVPPKDYRGVDWPPKNPTHQLNIDCRFQVDWANGPSDADFIFNCTLVAQPGDTSILPSFAGAGFGRLDSMDLVPAWYARAVTGYAGPAYPADKQNAIWHEFGHILGLPHIGVQTLHAPCFQAGAPKMDGGFTACYEGPTEEETQNVMGIGNSVSTRNSLPWLYRAWMHTGTHLVDWRVGMGPRPPRALKK